MGAVLIVGVLVFVWFREYAQVGNQDIVQPGEKVVVSEVTSSAQPTSDVQQNETPVPDQPQPTPGQLGQLLNQESQEPVTYTIEEVVQNLQVPWSIVFTGSDRMLVAERPGTVRVVENGQLKPEPLIRFQEVSSTGEEGLMGMTLHPDYDQNSWIYACLAYPKDGQLVDKVVRLIDRQDSLELDQVILDDIPAARFHAGCRVAFGPDEKLYVTTGDAIDKNLAQDLESLAGKTLRLNDDGSVPTDNPFPNSYVFSYGHRNAQGLDWHPITGEMYQSEHGPSVFDGPAGGDEVNLVRAGQNFGWPVVSHERSREGMIDPLLVFTPAEAPGSGSFYTGSVFPQFVNSFLFGALKGEGIIAVSFSLEAPSQVLSYEKLDISVGRVRDVVTGPDGMIYFSTSNTDGRGDDRPGDDKIYRVVPAE